MVTLQFIGKSAENLRFFIREDNHHAGGITIHSANGTSFSYGIAVSPALRRRGIARSALILLFVNMKERGYTDVFVQVAPSNHASLALHTQLGFTQTQVTPDAVHLHRTL